MVNKTIDKAAVKRTLASLSDTLETEFKRRFTQRICIGVTGLSGSGKSTFITSLINQLLNHKKARLGAFSPWLAKRILAVKLHPLEDRYLKRFDYHSSIKALSGARPDWPESTRDISGVLLEIKLRSNSRLARSGSRSLFVEIRDYPGEWLLDLPLLQQSYAQWSLDWKRRLESSPRSKLDDNPVELLSSVDPLLTADASVISRYAGCFTEFLKSSRRLSPPLQIAQPGRYLIPGAQGNAPEDRFFPLISVSQVEAESLKGAPKSSYYQELERRFERYKSEVVRPFFNQFIRPVERQVVLVDALSALKGDEQNLAEMIEALDMVSRSFEFTGRKLFGGHIEKVVFAATKVDQVIARDHDSVRQLLAAMLRSAIDQADYREVDYAVEATAAVRTTHEKVLKGEECLTGFTARAADDRQAIGYVHPEIPDHLPQVDDWLRFKHWSLPDLLPPPGMRVDQEEALPHIRMDQLLQNLLGDLCR